MDAIELGRQRAADLHFEAVRQGADPWNAYAFVLAEASRRGVDVEPTAPGAAVLDGSCATLVPGEDLIIHESAGTPFQQAFLVAHEIGHLELGDHPDIDEKCDIELSRPAEASPVGLDRVVDHGRRQRREVQMDLFAREFLLPRKFVERLHVTEEMSASAIADRLGAPFDFVAQQLLDALLLPPALPETSEDRPERPPNCLQTKAIEHRGKPYLLEAGPGTGKTQTLTARVQALLLEDVDPRRILLLTFSNKAAREMADRISLVRDDAAAAMWIGTFHAFGLDLIRRFHAELGLPKDPRLMDRAEAVELLEHEFPRLNLSHYRNLYDPTQIIADILAAISRAKDEVVDDAQYASLADAMRSKALTDEERKVAERAVEVAKVYTAYEELKRRAHCVDFGDLVSLPVRLLEGNDAIRAHLRGLYDHILVDEYQDVNRSSVRLLTALSPEGRNLWVVGDAKQSIYRFRGASSFNMHRFGREDFNGGVRGRLKKNYRSVEEVVGVFSAFAVNMRAGDRESGLEAKRGVSGFIPELRTVDRADEQIVALADAIEEMRQSGHAYRDQAVLCTGNEKLSNLAENLGRLGIPVLFLGSLFERSEVKDLIALLTLLTDGRAMGLLRLACMPDFAMPLDDVAAVMAQVRTSEGPTGAWLNGATPFQGVSEGAQRVLADISRVLQGFDRTAAPWTVLATALLDRTRVAARLSGSTDVVNRTRGIAIWQFMNFVRVQPPGGGLPIARLLDRVRRLVRLSDDRDLRQLPSAAQGLDAVRLSTIHGAKGLEFPVVHVPGLNADTIPRSQPAPSCPPPDGMVQGGEGTALALIRSAQEEEQECLFYVALSRARDRLFLYAPTQKSNGHKRPLSPFLGRLGRGLARKSVKPTKPLPQAPEDGDVELAVDGKLVFNASQIGLYESCPGRFLYTHLLEVGGRRRETAFMQMHEAVRVVSQAIVAGALPAGADLLEGHVAKAFFEHDLASHGYVAELKAFAVAMLRYFISGREGHTPEPPVALRLTVGGDEIVIHPDDVLVRTDGRRRIQQVKTGHKRSATGKDVEAAAFVLAARQAFPDADVELVHLSDEAVHPIVLSSKELQGRQGKLTEFLSRIRTGRFPADPSPMTCPNCPAFYVCGAMPPGILRKKFT